MRIWPSRPAALAFALAAAAVALSTAALLLARSVLHPTQAALVYLLVVWAVAMLSGTWPALLAAALSFAALIYFFLPPLYELWARSASDWVTLGVFLLVAVVQGIQTGKLRERESEARSREREAAALGLLAGKLVSEPSVEAMAVVVSEETAAVAHASRAAVIGSRRGSLTTIGATPGFEATADAGVERFARWSLENATAVGLPLAPDDARAASAWWPEVASYGEAVPGSDRADLFIPLNAAGSVEGVLYVGARSDRRPHSVEEARLAVSIAGLASVYLARRTLEDEARRARVVLETDLLKSTLVSSVSHELKTPLAAMTATVTGMLEGDAVLDPATVRRDLEVVRDGLERLNASIADLLDVSRLESEAWKPAPEPCDVGDVLGTVLARLDAADRARVDVALPPDLPAVMVDFGQWARALGNLIENGLEYSAPDGRVRVSADRESGGVSIAVEDEGPGISPEERELVFEKFYRGQAAHGHPSGTGLGLTITAEIVRFNGGTIRVESVMPHGARFIVDLPEASVESGGAGE